MTTETKSQPHPCEAGTCGHKRAGKPGHAERIRELERQWDALDTPQPTREDGDR